MRKPLVDLDLSNVASADHLHQLLSEALDFPSWYGKNWDAFRDSITGLVDMPAHLRFIGWSAFERRFPEDARILKECLDDMSGQFPTLAARVDYI